jgi:hypothetical protein
MIKVGHLIFNKLHRYVKANTAILDWLTNATPVEGGGVREYLLYFMYMYVVFIRIVV